jgi:prepilin-type N-terminal cleavage/methylation domain-containing protein
MRLNLVAGFSLIEVLVSLLLLSIILLNFDAIEIYALHSLQDTYYFNVAAGQLNNMAERLRALGKYQGVDQQIEIWNNQNQQLLPKSKGIIEGKYPVYHLTLYWGENFSLSQSLHL